MTAHRDRAPLALVVMAEGEPDADLVADVAAGLGFDVRRHLDAGSALEAVEYDHPALVVHGWDLPDMDAVTFHGAVRQRAGGSQVANVGVAPDRESASRLSWEAGEGEIVVRPLHRERLARRLEELASGAGGPTPDVPEVHSAAHEEWARPRVRESGMEQLEPRERPDSAAADLRVRVIGLGEWGVSGAELFARQGMAARGIDAGAGVEHADLQDGRRHAIALSGDHAAASRAMAVDSVVGEAIREDAGAELFLVIANLGVGAGSLAATLLARIADIAPRAGRLVVARLPGTRSGPEERALALVALNALLQGPASGIMVAQDVESPESSADLDPATPLHRLLDLWRLSSAAGAEPIRGISPSAVNRLLATPGFVGWRDTGLGADDAAGSGRGWHDLLEPAAWQPRGFSWSDAQAVLPVGVLPWSMLEGGAKRQLERFVHAVFPSGRAAESGGRVQFERFVQGAWDEAAPCTLVSGLYASDPPAAILVSVGMPYPQGILALRDSVEEDRARLTEKRRRAETLIPLGDDFLPNGFNPVFASPPAPAAPAPPAPRREPPPEPRIEPEPRWEPRFEPRPEPEQPRQQEPRWEPRPEPEIKPEPRYEPRYERRPEPEPRYEPRPEPEIRREPEPRPEPRPAPRPEPEIRREPEPRPAPRPEPEIRREPEPRPEPRPEFRAEPRPEAAPREYRFEPEPRSEPEPRDFDFAPEPRREARPEPAPRDFRFEPEPRREERPEPAPRDFQFEPEIRPEPRREPEPEPEPRHDPLPATPRPRADLTARPSRRRPAEARESAMPAPYETALALVRRIFTARDLRSEVDLGEMRYALYDLLELLREEPEAILPEVFRPEIDEWFERHHVNVAVLAILTGDIMKMSLSEVVDLGTAALLHDIGMLANREVWDVDMKLPPKVFEQAVRSHPEEGFRKLQDVTGMTGSIDRIVLEEHERMDGTGYPEGLAGDAIHPGARILAVCDSLEALTHPRPFRDHLSPIEALERITILAQYTLDPAVADALSGGLTELLEHGARETEPR